MAICKSDGRTKHGMSGSKTYRAWWDMKERCDSENVKQFHNYGGRGIKYQDSWSTFENFLADMGVCPDGLSLDRIDNDSGYSKENCRWTTMKQQSRNKSTNRLITYKGETKCVADWSEQYGFSKLLLINRIDRDGLSVEDAFEKPIPKRLKKEAIITDVPRLITYNNMTMTPGEWCRHLGLNRNFIYSRLRRGWSIEETFNSPKIVGFATHTLKRKPLLNQV